ncbi:MAG: hypothetical protein U0930_05395 [Pirellulales bacterium]
MIRDRNTRWLYLRNAWKTLWMGIDHFEYAHTTMGGYQHFKRQSDMLVESLSKSIEYYLRNAPFPRSMADMAAWKVEEAANR